MSSVGFAAVEQQAYSIVQFCAAHGISRATFYNLIDRGEAPRTMKVGARMLVSREAAADWRRDREGATRANVAIT